MISDVDAPGSPCYWANLGSLLSAPRDQRLSCQGTTSVVPNPKRIEEGFSPRLWQNHRVHLIRKT
jgi:hypothetical protein